MENAEAMTLARGETVEWAPDGRTWRLVVVRGWGLDGWGLDECRGVMVQVQRQGVNPKTGWPFPSYHTPPCRLRRRPDLPPAPANVYADWLEDHGQHEAARMLREAFPLGDSPTPPAAD